MTRDGQENLITSQRQWNITHLKSGLAVAGPYASVEETRRLASILARIDWKRGADMISRREIIAAPQIIEADDQALAEVEAPEGDRALARGSA